LTKDNFFRHDIISHDSCLCDNGCGFEESLSHCFSSPTCGSSKSLIIHLVLDRYFVHYQIMLLPALNNFVDYRFGLWIRYWSS